MLALPGLRLRGHHGLRGPRRDDRRPGTSAAPRQEPPCTNCSPRATAAGQHGISGAPSSPAAAPAPMTSPAAIQAITEMQAGSYATMDAKYQEVGTADFELALTVVARVISVPNADRPSSTPGIKTITTEFGLPRLRPSRAAGRCRLLRGARQARAPRRRAAQARATAWRSCPRTAAPPSTCTTPTMSPATTCWRPSGPSPRAATCARAS